VNDYEQEGKMAHLLISWVVVTAGILLAAYLIPGIRVAGIKDALIAAVVLGLLNVLLRPILLFLSFPITIITLGLFIFVVNALVFWLAGQLMRGFQVDSFVPALWGSLVVSAVSFVSNLVRL
jgi:putative membrane protein